MNEKIVGYGLVNLHTGQITDEFLILRRTTNVGGLWMRAYQDAMQRISRAKLRGESHRVLLYMMGASGFQNKPPTVKKIATALDMKPPHISRAFKELEKCGVVIKEDNIYSLNPYFFWKGTSKQLATRLEELRVQNLEFIKELGTTPETILEQYKESVKEYPDKDNPS